jgi:hypothetical protein
MPVAHQPHRTTSNPEDQEISLGFSLPQRNAFTAASEIPLQGFIIRVFLLLDTLIVSSLSSDHSARNPLGNLP